MRSAQEVCSAPESMKRVSSTRLCPSVPTSPVEGEPGEQRGDQHEARGDDLACAREATSQPKKPAKIAPIKGRKTIA